MFSHYIGSVQFPIINVVRGSTWLWTKGKNLAVIHSYRASKHRALMDRGRVEKICDEWYNRVILVYGGIPE